MISLWISLEVLWNPVGSYVVRIRGLSEILSITRHCQTLLPRAGRVVSHTTETDRPLVQWCVVQLSPRGSELTPILPAHYQQASLPLRALGISSPPSDVWWTSPTGPICPVPVGRTCGRICHGLWTRRTYSHAIRIRCAWRTTAPWDLTN
jgi:hypothetical protein